jgi:hypothetical protein
LQDKCFRFTFCVPLSTSTQKERKIFSLEEKLKILQDVEKHMTHISLSKQLGISVSTLNTIVKDQKIIEENANQCRQMVTKQKSRFEKLEDILKEWFENARLSNLPVSGGVLWEKAMHIAKGLHTDNLSASNGWTDRFKQRHNLVYKCLWREFQC